MRLTPVVILVAVLCHPTTSSFANWLQLPTDVRSRALGNAGTALPNLEFALDANPALLTKSEHGGGGISYGKLTSPYFYNNGGLTTAYGVIGTKALRNRFSVSLAYQHLGVDFTSAQVTNQALLLGLGGVVTRQLSAGATLKWSNDSYSESFGNSSETSHWGVDFGLYLDDLIPAATIESAGKATELAQPPPKLSRPRARGFGLGVAVRNFGERFESSATEEYVFPEEVLSVGVSYLPILVPDFALLLVTEAWISDPLETSPFAKDQWVDLLRWGVETSVKRSVDLRFGMESDLSSGDARFTVGAGLGPERIRFNVALSWDIVEGIYGYTDEAEQRLGFSVQL